MMISLKKLLAYVRKGKVSFALFYIPFLFVIITNMTKGLIGTRDFLGDFYNYAVTIIIFAWIMWLGAFFNLLAVYFNGGKMPVKCYRLGKPSNTHFAMRNRKVKFYIFCDIIIIRTKKYFSANSVGDLLIGIGVLGHVIAWILYLIHIIF